MEEGKMAWRGDLVGLQEESHGGNEGSGRWNRGDLQGKEWTLSVAKTFDECVERSEIREVKMGGGGRGEEVKSVCVEKRSDGVLVCGGPTVEYRRPWYRVFLTRTVSTCIKKRIKTLAIQDANKKYKSLVNIFFQAGSVHCTPAEIGGEMGKLVFRRDSFPIIWQWVGYFRSQIDHLSPNSYKSEQDILTILCALMLKVWIWMFMVQLCTHQKTHYLPMGKNDRKSRTFYRKCHKFLP